MTDGRHVHIVDDEESVRRSIAFMLRTSGFTVTAWDSGVAFLAGARKAEAGCVLLDIRMPDMDGLRVQHEMACRGNGLPVIVLTGHGDVATAVTAMRQGAVDFLEKPFEKAALLAALERGAAMLKDRDAARANAHDARVRLAALTAREQEVLQGLVRGHPNKTIAFDLGISPRTVEVHRAHVMEKLEVHSLSEVLRLAFSAGWTID